jgi:hypothetical protein
MMVTPEAPVKVVKGEDGDRIEHGVVGEVGVNVHDQCGNLYIGDIKSEHAEGREHGKHGGTEKGHEE